MTGAEIALGIAGLAVPALGGLGVLLVRVGGMIARLDEVHAQLHPNGGASLRDAVDRQGKTLGTVAVQVDGVHEQLAAHMTMPAGVAHG